MSQSTNTDNARVSFRYDFHPSEMGLIFAEGEVCIIVQQEAPWAISVSTRAKTERLLGCKSLPDALARAVGVAARHTLPSKGC